MWGTHLRFLLPLGSVLPDLAPAKAVRQVIIYHAGRLHKGVADGAADELKPALAQIFAHGIRLRRSSGNLLQRRPGVLNRLAAHKLPDVGIERSELFLRLKKGLRVLYCRVDLQPVPHDTRIAEKSSEFRVIVGSHAAGIETVEGGPVVLPLVENRLPTQSRLRAFKDKHLEQVSIVVRGHSPLVVMIVAVELAFRPRATNDIGHDKLTRKTQETKRPVT